MSEIEFVDEGEVELVDHMGGDLSIVNSARVSFGRRDDVLDEAGRGLIRFLMANRHGTPFESCVMTFRVECPIFVAREWLRHRVGSFNEYSARYKQMRPRFFVPRPEDVRSQVGKPGAYRFEQAPEVLAECTRAAVKTEYLNNWNTYEDLLRDGVAKEQARLVLPVGIMTEFVWTVNARSLMNFLSLRLAPNAMKEIRDLAEEVDILFNDVAPVTQQAFEDNGRTAP